MTARPSKVSAASSILDLLRARQNNTPATTPVPTTPKVVRHRDDGPAIYFSDGTVQFFIHGEDMSLEVDEWMERDNIPPVTQWGNVERAMFKMKFGGK